MATYTKRQLVKELQELINSSNFLKSQFNNGTYKTYISEKDTIKLVDFIIDQIANNLKAQNKILITGFFSAFLKEFKRKNARNPRTGETVVIKPFNKVKLYPLTGFNRKVGTRIKD